MPFLSRSDPAPGRGGSIDHYRVDNPAPVIAFEYDNRERYLVVNGKRVFDLGFGGCDTCAFLFEKKGYESRLSPLALATILRAGHDLLDPAVLATVGSILPSDDYGVVATDVRPVETGPGEADDYFAHESIDFFGLDPTWGVADTPRTRYYRAGHSTLPVTAGEPRNWATEDDLPTFQRFFHFLVPMEPIHTLHRARVDQFREWLTRGERPAAVGVSVLDRRAKAIDPGAGAADSLLDAEEWCLVTYLIDGHHKVQAAAETGLPIRLLAFIARAPSVAQEEDIKVALAELASWADPPGP